MLVHDSTLSLLKWLKSRPFDYLVAGSAPQQGILSFSRFPLPSFLLFLSHRALFLLFNKPNFPVQSLNCIPKQTPCLESTALTMLEPHAVVQLVMPDPKNIRERDGLGDYVQQLPQKKFTWGPL